MRTNYKLRVGEKPIGRYTPYSQVRIPPTGEYGSEEATKFYRHPKVIVVTGGTYLMILDIEGHSSKVIRY